MYTQDERRAQGRQCATCDYRFTFMLGRPTQCRQCAGTDRPIPYDQPAVVMTKDGPQALLPGLAPTDETKGEHAQRRMF